MSRAWPKSAVGWLVAWAASGCTLGPDLKPPAPPSPAGYTREALPERTAGAAVETGGEQRFVLGADVPPRWWTVFDAETLDATVDAALRANPDLEAAGAALLAAREAALAQHGALWPAVQAHVTSSRQAVSGTLTSPLSSGAALYSLHSAQLEVSYVADVFGGTRRAIEAADAQVQVQRFQREAIYLTLTGNVVVAALQEAALRAQVAKTHELIEVAVRQLALMLRQRRAGMIGAADVAAQEVVVAQARASLPPLEKQLGQLRDQLSALTGRLPSEAGIGQPLDLDRLRLPAELPVVLPAMLVERRPDVQAAIAQLQVASAQVGVARAARLPAITLSASRGSAAEAVSQLFNSGSAFWSLAADVVQPLFDAGSLEHREAAARANYDQALAQYRGAVIGAFQNVADALLAVDADARALLAAAELASAAGRSADIAQRQWRAGNAAYPSVLIAQQAHLQAELGLIQARAARLIDTAMLFQALGGDWRQRSASAS
jgi:NodT family efflux transporter outer membrane factor (OMF) lipoprotein